MSSFVVNCNVFPASQSQRTPHGGLQILPSFAYVHPLKEGFGGECGPLPCCQFTLGLIDPDTGHDFNAMLSVCLICLYSTVPLYCVSGGVFCSEGVTVSIDHFVCINM